VYLGGEANLPVEKFESGRGSTGCKGGIDAFSAVD